MAWQHTVFGLSIFALFNGWGFTQQASAQSPLHSPTVEQAKGSPVQSSSYIDNAAANRLARLATQINGVKQATVVVLGNYAVVGLTIDPTLDRHKTGNVKYDVANVIKNDPKGAKAFVTSDPNLVQRLKDIRSEIQNGKPVQGILQQLALVVERIMPDASSDFLKQRSTPYR